MDCKDVFVPDVGVATLSNVKIVCLILSIFSWGNELAISSSSYPVFENLKMELNYNTCIDYLS